MHPLQLETRSTPRPRRDMHFAIQSTRAGAERASVLWEVPRPNIVARFRSQSYGILRSAPQNAPCGGAHGRFQGAAQVLAITMIQIYRRACRPNARPPALSLLSKVCN